MAPPKSNFTYREKMILYDLIEKYDKEDLSLHCNVRKAKSVWGEITEDYNSSVKLGRTTNQLMNLWSQTKEMFYRKIVAEGLKKIFEFSLRELKFLSLIPSSYFSSICKELEFERSLKLATSLARQHADKSEAYSSSKFENYFAPEAMEEDPLLPSYAQNCIAMEEVDPLLPSYAQNSNAIKEEDPLLPIYAQNSKALEENPLLLSNDQNSIPMKEEEPLFSSYAQSGKALDDEGPLLSSYTQNINISLNNEREFLYSNSRGIKEEAAMELDVNLSYENSFVDSATKNESCRLTSVCKQEIKKFGPKLKVSDRPLGVADSFYRSPLPNNVINENAKDTSQSDSTSPFIVNVQSLTSEQFNECEQESDRLYLTEDDITPVNFDTVIPVNFDTATLGNFDIISPVTIASNSLFKRSAKTTPNFPNAVFEFEEATQISIPITVTPPVILTAATSVMPPEIRTAATSVMPPEILTAAVMPPEIHAAATDIHSNVLYSDECFQDKLEKKEIIFACEMDELQKERECMDNEHKMVMKSLNYELKALNCQFRDMVRARQLCDADNRILVPFKK